MYKTPPHRILEFTKKKVWTYICISTDLSPWDSMSFLISICRMVTKSVSAPKPAPLQVWIQLTVVQFCKISVSDNKSPAFLRAQCSFSSTHIWMGLHIFSVQVLHSYRKKPKCFYLWRTILSLELNLIGQNCQQFILQVPVYKEKFKRKDVVSDT